MKYTLLAIGSRGDVQPFVALGYRLQQQGHRVRVAAASDYRGLVEAHGLAFHDVVGSIQEFVDPEMSRAFQGRVGKPLRGFYHYVNTIEPLLHRMLNDCWEASRDADALIVSTLGRYCGDPIAQRLLIPMHIAHPHPNTPTSTQPHMQFPTLPAWVPGQASYNRLSYTLTEMVFWLCFQRPLNSIRRNLGLLPESARSSFKRHQRDVHPTLYAYSKHIAPLPPATNTANNIITGYWFLPEQPWEPPRDLVRFLEAGEPPLLFTFGSMMLGQDAPQITNWIKAIVQRLGQRALIFRGWNELGTGNLPSSMLAIDTTPHQWLLPHVRAVVHHGGAGSTAAALYAKTPALIVPFLGDQYFWGHRLAALGATPKPIPRLKLTHRDLDYAVEDLISTQRYRDRTIMLGTQIASERGVEEAITHLEQYGG